MSGERSLAEALAVLQGLGNGADLSARISALSSDVAKERYLCVVGKDVPLRFLNNRRSIDSVLSKHSAVAAEFSRLYRQTYLTVREYYAAVRDRVHLVDLRDHVPEFRGSSGDPDALSQRR